MGAGEGRLRFLPASRSPGDAHALVCGPSVCDFRSQVHWIWILTSYLEAVTLANYLTPRCLPALCLCPFVESAEGSEREIPGHGCINTQAEILNPSFPPTPLPQLSC